MQMSQTKSAYICILNYSKTSSPWVMLKKNYFGEAFMRKILT